MSLLSSLQVAGNSLLATQVGLQVIGNNVANANTPGYTRQEVVYAPAPTQLIGTLPIGLGVQVRAIIQQTDRFINERLRGANSDVANTETQKHTYLQLESIVGELSDTDLSSSLNRFFSSIQDVLNQPEDLAIRNLAALQGKSLSEDIRRLDSRIRQIRSDVNDSIASAANDINRLLQEVARLNVGIVAAEGGASTGSEAGGMRDQRNLALGELSKMINIRVVEQQSGAVTVFANGDYLVFDGEARPVTVRYTDDRGMASASINILDSDSPLDASSGKLAGMYIARDEILGGYLNNLDQFVENLVFEFNKVFSSGQGDTGFDSVTSEFNIRDTDEPLDQAGLAFTPVNGTFQVIVRNKRTEVSVTSDVRIDLNGLDRDTSLEDLAEHLSAIDGISASINSEGYLQISSDSPSIEFAFANDTSGVLAALGINTFFSGSTARDIGVNRVVANDSSKFAVSRGGIGEDSDNAVLLAGLSTEKLAATGGRSLIEFYERFNGQMFQASAAVQAINDGFLSFQKTLEGQQLGVSGVSVDEQAVKMIQHQRIYQASARLISAVNDLLESLMNL